jgi:hypothetical protein
VREALAGVTPDEVRLRPSKSVFDALFHEVMAGSDLGPLRRLLDTNALVREFVDIDAVGAMLEPPPPGQRGEWAIAVWRLATLELWLRAQASGRLLATVETLGLAPADVAITSGP